MGVSQSSDTKVERQGNCFYTVKTDTVKKTTQKAEPIFTGCTTKDPKGVERQVFQGPKGGLYYVNDKGTKVYKIDEGVKARIREEMQKGGTK